MVQLLAPAPASRGSSLLAAPAATRDLSALRWCEAVAPHRVGRSRRSLAATSEAGDNCGAAGPGVIRVHAAKTEPRDPDWHYGMYMRYGYSIDSTHHIL